MVRWFKLSQNQYLGFWPLAFLLFALQELPYMIMPLFALESNPIMTMEESSAALNICEKALGSLCIMCMTFVVHKDMTVLGLQKGINRAGLACAAAALLLNYTGWLLYFNGHQAIGLMLFFIVALPPLYYVFIGLWRENWILSVISAAFGAVHFIHVWGNLTA